MARKLFQLFSILFGLCLVIVTVWLKTTEADIFSKDPQLALVLVGMGCICIFLTPVLPSENERKKKL